MDAQKIWKFSKKSFSKITIMFCLMQKKNKTNSLTWEYNGERYIILLNFLKNYNNLLAYFKAIRRAFKGMKFCKFRTNTYIKNSKYMKK